MVLRSSDGGGRGGEVVVVIVVIVGWWQQWQKRRQWCGGFLKTGQQGPKGDDSNRIVGNLEYSAGEISQECHELDKVREKKY